MARPAERVVPWFEYRNIFLTEERIAAGVQFWSEHAADGRADRGALRRCAGDDRRDRRHRDVLRPAHGPLSRARRARDAGVRVSAARRVLHVRSSSRSCCSRARSRSIPTAALGSYAGAMGAGQFIPSSYRAYAVDADADGKRDMWTNWDDVFGSVANYFTKHGWRAGEPVMDARDSAGAAVGARAAQQARSRRHRRLGDQAGLRVHDDDAADAPAARVLVRGRRRRLRVLGRLPQLSRRHALQPQHEVRARGASASEAIRSRYFEAVASNAGSAVDAGSDARGRATHGAVAE